MNEQELEDHLREALLLANSPKYLKTPEEAPFVPSRSFQRRIKRLLKNPARYLRRQARPVWRKALEMAATLLLCLSLTLAGVLALSPTARAWVESVVVAWLEEYVVFQFTGEPVVVGGVWRPTWLPEGFKEVSAYESDGYGTIIFEKKDGTAFSFKYQPMINENQFNVDNEHREYKEIIIDGNRAFLFMADSFSNNSQLIWLNEEKLISFRLVGMLTEEELIMIAESIEEI